VGHGKKSPAANSCPYLQTKEYHVTKFAYTRSVITTVHKTIRTPAHCNITE